MTKNISYLFIIFFLSACTIQKAYIVNPPNVNCFRYENEKNIKFAFMGSNLNAHFNAALNKKFGIASTLYGGLGDEMSNYYGTEMAGIYYKYLNNHVYIETQAGYGYCINQLETSWNTISLPPMTRYRCFSNTNYHKLYLQPCVFFVRKNISLGLASKFNLVYYANYHYSFDKELTKDYYLEQTKITGETGDVSFKNKFGFVFESAVTLKFIDMIFIQLDGHIADNIFTGKTKAYSTTYGKALNSEQNTFSNPQLTYFKCNIGVEFKLGKNKKQINHE